VPKNFLDFQNAISVIADKSHVVFVGDRARADRDKAIIRGIALLDAIPEFIRVEAALPQIFLLREPACEHVQILRRVAPVEIVATAHLEVSLFDETDPELTLGGVGTKPVTIHVDWEVVVNRDAPPSAVHKQFDSVLASWIVDRVPIVVLGKDIVRDNPLFPLRLELEMGSDCKGGKDRAITHFLLHDLVAGDLSSDIWHAIDPLLGRDVVLRPSPLSQALHLTNR